MVISNNFSTDKKYLYFPTKKWLEQKPLVVVGYADSRGVNLAYLLGLWIECQQEKEAFEDIYPAAAMHFQIEVVEKDGSQKFLEDILPDFEGCSHIQAWSFGEEYNPNPELTLTHIDN